MRREGGGEPPPAAELGSHKGLDGCRTRDSLAGIGEAVGLQQVVPVGGEVLLRPVPGTVDLQAGAQEGCTQTSVNTTVIRWLRYIWKIKKCGIGLILLNMS